ncbi:hypothetical protein K439DRAFT_1158809 [Ramaria rubella]|nr:hypothetical protein K439DRAFT_1158809 [Ramaria rubella]
MDGLLLHPNTQHNQNHKHTALPYPTPYTHAAPPYHLSRYCAPVRLRYQIDWLPDSVKPSRFVVTQSTAVDGAGVKPRPDICLEAAALPELPPHRTSCGIYTSVSTFPLTDRPDRPAQQRPPAH